MDYFNPAHLLAQHPGLAPMLIPVTRIMIRLQNSVPTLGINGRQVDVEDLGTQKKHKKTSRFVVGHTSIYFPSSHCCCLLCPQCFGHPSCAIPFPGVQWLKAQSTWIFHSPPFSCGLSTIPKRLHFCRPKLQHLLLRLHRSLRFLRPLGQAEDLPEGLEGRGCSKVPITLMKPA